MIQKVTKELEIEREIASKMSSTIDQSEIEKFSRIADEWWDEDGKFKPLHKLNPTRISYIRKKIEEKFSKISLTNILDIGCGGGLISEPFSRMGSSVTAIDASEKNIEIAKIHAEKSGLKIDYKVGVAEEITDQFDVVLALEIIEHVADVEKFISSCAKLIKPNGLLFIATINRNLKSLLLAKFVTEYILKWLPAGTHDWRKFLKPSEINLIAERYGLTLQQLRGFSYNPVKDEWKESSDINVNYIMVFQERSA